MGDAVEFVSGGSTVHGKLFPAHGSRALATVLLLPGFPGNEDDVLGLGTTLAGAGMNSLMINYRGTFASQGRYSVANTQEDIASALAFLARAEVRQQYAIEAGDVVLVGYSYGGGMALAYAAAHPQIKRVCSIAGTDHGEFVREYLRNPAFAEMIDSDFDELRAPTGPVRFAEERPVDELERNADPYDLRSQSGTLVDRDIFLIGGWDDPYVTIEAHVLPVYRSLTAAGSPFVRLRVFQDGHTFERTSGEVGAAVADWIAGS